LLGLLIPFFGLIYYIAIATAAKDGIWKVWIKDRIRMDLGGIEPTKFSGRGLKAIAFSLYFSLLSAFSIGWRELNVGNWITKIQPHEYSLRPTGWVRTASGIQSLLSVYLLALWILTFFGRPFQ